MGKNDLLIQNSSNLTSPDTQGVIATKHNNGSIKNINKMYLLGLLFTISFGTIQFGYSIGSWNTANDAFVHLQGWEKDSDEGKNYQTLAQSLTTLGAAVGALFSGPVLKFGRWKCILFTNLFVIMGAGLTIVSDKTIVLIGRFLYGIACGAFSVFCPKYISEVAPTEIKGPAGALSQICITFGILVPFSIGILYPSIDDDIKNQELVNIVFTIPMALAAAQIVLMVFIYPYDTPVMLKQNGRHEKLREFMCKIYNPYVVQERIDEIAVGNLDNTELGGMKDYDIGYSAVCCSPSYTKSTFVGCALSIFQQLTGINFIMFYSNTLFSNLGMKPQTITGLVGLVNFLTTFGGLFLLSVAGRRTIMITMSAAMSVILVLNGIFSLNDSSTYAIICTMCFIGAFEFSSGPITWLYMAEIMQDKAVSIATVLNWVINLIISLITPSLISAIGKENIGYIFICCGGFTVLGTLFMILFMKETRGKTQAEIEEMFANPASEEQVLYGKKIFDASERDNQF